MTAQRPSIRPGLPLWLDTPDRPSQRRGALTGDRVVDVAIVGAGFTGLWAAYHLVVSNPALEIAVVEREFAGFGASGRNGGWCSALFAASWSKVARSAGRDAAIGMQRALVESVVEIGAFCAHEGVAADYARGGTVVLARSPAQLSRLAAGAAEARDWGVEVHWLSAAQAQARVGASRVLGGTWAPDTAALHPGRLVRGLAVAAERLGVTIYEGTPATGIGPGRVDTPGGRLRARYVVRATEGFTPQLPGLRRAVAPVYSLMVATEPLPKEFWDEVGWRNRETLSDGRHLLIYGQRTADDRIAFGGRGAPYHLGSRVAPRFDRDPGVFAALRATLVDLFPALASARITHQWGGPIAVPRDWFPSVGLDRGTGMAWAGGYVGDGVACSYLAGRTLAELICGGPSEQSRLPWVGHRSPRWEPEPLRWLGLNAGLRIMASADRAEERTGRPSRRAAWFGRFLGG